MKELFKNYSIIAIMMAVFFGFATSCSEDEREVEKETGDEFTQMMAALNSGKLKPAESVVKLTSVIDNMPSAPEMKLQRLTSEINSKNNQLDAKLAVTEAGMKAQSFVPDAKMNLMETAVKALPDYPSQLKAVRWALVAMPDLNNKLTVVEKAVVIVPDNSDKLNLLETSLDDIGRQIKDDKNIPIDDVDRFDREMPFFKNILEEAKKIREPKESIEEIIDRIGRFRDPVYSKPYITLTTEKAIGDTITISISTYDGYEAGCWVDLNNNGKKDAGEEVKEFNSYLKYNLISQTFKVYGKVSYFTCDGNYLTALDVSHNTALKSLGCAVNRLTTLDVSKNAELGGLSCANNKLTTLDVSKNTALEQLVCEGNNLTTLDVSKNTALWLLVCDNNNLTSLDVSRNTALKKLYCGENNLTSLDVSKNTELYELYCYSNNINDANMTVLVKSLVDRSSKTSGKFFVVNTKDPDEKNVCTKANVKTAKDKNWEVLNYGGGVENPDYPGSDGALVTDSYITLTTSKAKGETIELSIDADIAHRAGCWIDLNNNGKKDDGEDVKKFYDKAEYTLGSQTIKVYGKVDNFSCHEQSITALDVSHNLALKKLYCGENKLTTLDVSRNMALELLACFGNKITSLDVSRNTALKILSCNANAFTSLDVSRNTALEELLCGENNLTSLDVSRNTALKMLMCSSNKLTSLDVSRNTALMSLNCDDNKLTTLDVSRNTALMYLCCGADKLTTLDVSRNTALVYLACNANDLKKLDVSRNTALKYLCCNANALTSLDVSRNTALEELLCSQNNLTSLDVSKNKELKKLNCFSNNINDAEMTVLVKSLVDRSSREEGEFLVRNYALVEENVCSKANVAIAKGKNWRVLGYDGLDWNDYHGSGGGGGTPVTDSYMTLTTTMGSGTQISFSIKADAADQAGCWIDLNNNGRKDAGEDVTKFNGYAHYTLGSQTIKVYGKVKEFNCSNDSITSLDVSKNASLEALYCYLNKISANNIPYLINSLPNRQSKTPGRIYLVDESNPNEMHVCDIYNKEIANRKNWEIWDFNRGEPRLYNIR